VTVAPSAALWYQAVRAGPRPGHVVVAAGPDLPAAQIEATRIAELYADVRLLLGTEATVAATRAALNGSGVAHIAAHGRLRADNPLFSSLRMSDGPLTVYDLDTLGTAPRLVVLAACDGALSYTLAGDEVLGLAAGFLAHGTAALIGPLGFVPDGAMADLMVDLHTRLATGMSPATALVGMRATAADGPPAMRAAAASLICLGAGHSAGRTPE
jgi:CHAT domain-containing protein